MAPATPPGPAGARVCFLGTGNAFNHDTKANQSLHISAADATPIASQSNGSPALRTAAAGCSWLLDCGPTSLLRLTQFGVDLHRLDGIALTHLHGDHALGVPMVILHLLYIERRTRPLTIVGPPGTQSYVDRAWHLAYPDVAARPLSFELQVFELDGEAGECLTLEHIAFETVSMRHSIPVNGYRARLGGRLVALSGDTGPTDALLRLGRDADLLIVECSFELPFDPPLHLSIEELKPVLPYGARQVALIHTSPPVWARRRALEQELQVIMPEDGDCIEV